eukprot:GHVU01230010.1.p2 GENE.GHVU01230010.1~~GHVU01230010.1.p2  ORF type:complete len:113 (-),score=4.04 GHVU01230010.1:588-926(-)
MGTMATNRQCRVRACVHAWVADVRACMSGRRACVRAWVADVRGWVADVRACVHVRRYACSSVRGSKLAESRSRVRVREGACLPARLSACHVIDGGSSFQRSGGVHTYVRTVL